MLLNCTAPAFPCKHFFISWPNGGNLRSTTAHLELLLAGAQATNHKKSDLLLLTKIILNYKIKLHNNKNCESINYVKTPRETKTPSPQARNHGS